VGCS